MERDADGAARRVLVIANETCRGRRLLDEVCRRAGRDAEVLVVAPALTARLRHWVSDVDSGLAAAEQRVRESVEALAACGVQARGEVGDGDPLMAIEDALRLFPADEIVLSTHPPGRSNWLEKKVVRRARERFEVPITHVVVDLAHEQEAEPLAAAARRA